MTLVLIASQPNGTRQDTHGEAKSDQVEFRLANGTAPDHFDGTLVATYTDSAGTGSSTAAFSADSRGRWMRYIAAGVYKQIVNPGDVSRRESLEFHATPGSVDRSVVNAGSLGATYTLALAGQRNALLVGTLNANNVTTVTGLTAGCKFDLLVTQDVTGGRTFTLSDGVTSTVVAVDAAASHSTLVECYSPDGTTIYASDLNANFGADHDGVLVGEDIAPSQPSTTNIGAASRAQWVTFVARRNLTVTQIKFIVLTASGTDDAIDVGLYNSTGAKLATAGATTGKLNAGTGIKAVSLSGSVSLVAGQRYYAGVSCNSTTAVFLSRNFTQSTPGQIYGTAPPGLDFGAAATSHPLPDPMPGSLTSLGVSNFLQLWVMP